MPNVTVIIPTYNRRRLLLEAIDSVFAQSFADWELIVIDDGSTDGTRDAVTQRYADTISYVFQQNCGEAAARNRGLALARGRYTAFLDSDDLWSPTKLQRQVAVLDSEPQVGLVYTRAYWLNYAGLRLRRPPHGHDRDSETVTWADLVVSNVVAGGGSSAMIRRECVDAVGGFDEAIRFAEEWDLWLRIARDFQVWQIPEPLTYSRINPHGARNWAPRPEEAERMHLDHLAILERAFERCPDSIANCEGLRGQAFGRAYLRHALVCCATGLADPGLEAWTKAIEWCPEYACDGAVVAQRITGLVAAYAHLAEPSARIGVARAVLERLLTTLPEPLGYLRAEGKRVLARVLAELAFLAAEDQDVSLVRRLALECLTADPAWLPNVGLVKALLNGGRHLWPVPIGKS